MFHWMNNGDQMAGIVGKSADSVKCWQMHCRFAPNQGRIILCCLCAVPSFVVLPGILMCVSCMGELTVWIVFPTVAIHMYTIDHRHWFHWTAVWLQLHVSLVHVSACSFAVSQASDLALLVGYVAYKRTLTLNVVKMYIWWMQCCLRWKYD